jgi:hypothetical protein
MVFMKSKIPHYVSPAPPMGGMRFKFNYWRGGPLPTTYLCNAGRAGQGREGGFICPFFCFSLAGMNSPLFPKLVIIIFYFFPKEFYYNWREPYLTRCWQHSPKSRLILAQGLSEASP